VWPIGPVRWPRWSACRSPGVRNLIKRGTLRAVQLDGRWLIPAAVIEDKLGVSLDARPTSDAASIRPITGQPPPGGDLDVA